MSKRIFEDATRMLNRRTLAWVCAAILLVFPGCGGGSGPGCGDSNNVSSYLPYSEYPEDRLTLTSITPRTIVRPNAGTPDATVNVTITGRNIPHIARLQVVGPGITVADFTWVSDTKITAVLTVAGTAPYGAHAVGVITDDLTSNTLALNLTSGNPPTLTSITPSSGERGSVVPVTLNGTNFVVGSTTVQVGGLLSVSDVRLLSGTQLTATLTIPPDAALGEHRVTVTKYGEITNPLLFNVTAASANSPHTITSVTPNSGAQGETLSLVITGTNFVQGAQILVNALNPPIPASAITVVSPSRIEANFTLPLDAPVGLHDLLVFQNGRTSDALPFTVLATGTDNTPTLTNVTPNEIGRGSHLVTLTGTNFTYLSTVLVSGGGTVSISDVTFVSSTQITATFEVSGTFSSGQRGVTVTNANGTTNAVPIFLYQ